MLDFRRTDSPKHPRPLDVSNGMEVVSTVRINHETDGIAQTNVFVQLVEDFFQIRRVSFNVTLVLSFSDDVCEHIRCRFYLLGETDST